jgi:hypothetical protein
MFLSGKKGSVCINYCFLGGKMDFVLCVIKPFMINRELNKGLEVQIEKNVHEICAALLWSLEMFVALNFPSTAVRTVGQRPNSELFFC